MIIESEDFGYPVRHVRKQPFMPYYRLSPEMNRLNIEIFQLEAELDRFILTFDDYEDLMTEAFSSNIHLSTQLEGNPLTRADVRRFTRKVVGERLTDTHVDFSHQEILNHLVAYLNPSFHGTWDLATLKTVHRMLLFGDPDSAPGEFRNDNFSVQSTDGQELFIPAPPEHIEDELLSLLLWLNTIGMGTYPTVSGALFFHEFESIHPFKDGNGRCGRSLFHIYLQHHGLSNSKLCFIEQHIVSNPEKYYELLARTDHYQNYDDLIKHFTKAVHGSYVEAVERFLEKDLLSSNLNEGAKRALSMAKQYGRWFNIQFAKSWFENTSDHKVRMRLNELVDCGALISEGSTRSKRYRYLDPIEDTFQAVQQVIESGFLPETEEEFEKEMERKKRGK